LKDYLKAGNMRGKLGRHSPRGQSLVELALILPVLITLLIGMVEVVNIGRTYLALLDTSYQGAHLGSQGSILYNDAKVDILVDQDLTNKGLNTSSLIEVVITHADIDASTNPPTIKNLTTYPVTPPRPSKLTKVLLDSRLQSSDPKGKLVAVEIVYDYKLLFPWPNFAGILPNPFPIRAYTIQYAPRD
jgi:hypothetical protein